MFASFKEGFDDRFQFRQEMDNVFNNILPNFVGTTSEGARIVRENPNVALRLDAAIADNVGGQSGKVIIPRADSIFQSIEASPHLQNLNEICKTSSVDELIGSTNPADKYRCGWIYQRDPTGIAPKISTGYLGSRSGPLQLFGQSPAGQWYWDLEAAKKQALMDKCSHVTACGHLGSPLLNGDCGFCNGASKKSIVIGRDGKPLYPTDQGQSCPVDKIIRTADQCPPPPPPAPPRRDAEGNIIPEPETPMTVCRQLPNGKISRDCLVQQLKLGGCGDMGSLAQALRGSRDPRDLTDTIRPNQAFMVYQERSPAKLKEEIIRDGSIAAEAALADFTALYQSAQGSEATGLRAAAQDLCVRAGAIEEFDFCSEIQDSATPPFGLDCMQKEFKRVGGLPAGEKYPTNRNLTDFNGFSTWGAYKEFVRDLARRTQSTDPEIQAFALKDLMGINRELLGAPKMPSVNAYEIFAFGWHNNNDALFMGRIFQSGRSGLPIITDASKLPALAGIENSSFVILTDLRPSGSADIQLSFPAGMGNGVTATINTDRDNQQEINKNHPNDYRRDFLHQQNQSTNTSCTQLKAGGKNYLKAYCSMKVRLPTSFRILYNLCNQGGNPMSIPANWISLSQEFRAPMLSFEVRRRGVRDRPSIMGLHEYRMSDFFIADNSNVYVEDRETNAAPNGLKSITFESTNSKWEINKLMHHDSWQSLTFCFKLNRPNKSSSEAIMAWRIAALGIRSLNDGNVSFDLPEANQLFRAQIGKWYCVNITKTSSGGYLNNDITVAMYEYNMARGGVTLTEPANVFKKVYMRNNPLTPGPQFGIMSWGADSSGEISAGFSLAWVRLYDYALDAENFSKDINNKWIRDWAAP